MKSTYGYHTSNPVFRQSIMANGLEARAGWSYKYNHGEDVKPAIFFALSWEDRFNSTHDDDVYKVLLDELILHPDPVLPAHVLTYAPLILPQFLELVYTGTHTRYY